MFFVQFAEMRFRETFDLSVYFVVDPSVCNGREVESVVAAAARGGVTMVQLRNKTDPIDVVERQARVTQDILADSGIPFILNDHVELAAMIGADGVHIGQEDMSAKNARDIIGESAILGVTAYTEAHYAAIDSSVVDYVGTGPFYATKTKPDKAVLGAEGFKNLVYGVPIPVVGIGGVTAENAASVIVAGASGVAMMRSLSEADDVEAVAREFVEKVRGVRYENS
ncbi:MAG: thiamine phosphate synthase [Alphaproteobacteria bacterium]